MGIKRYTAYKDNTITNAYKANLETRATGSNMGLADSMEIFSIYAQANSSSLEASRVLVQFPVSSSDPGTTILSDRTAGKIPASGSVGFYLKLANVVSTTTVPRDFTLVVSPVSQSWQEGYGLDMENYSDQTYNGTGSNWINAGSVSGYGTSTLAIVDYSIIEADPDNAEITITTTNGTTISAVGGFSKSTSTTDTDDPTFNVATSNTNTATNLATCLNANSKLSATSLGGVVTVIQVVGGLTSNTAVSVLVAPGGMTVTDFTGGSGGAWTNEGGDYLTASAYSAVNYKQTFRIGIEDLEVDITKLVESWVTGTAGSGYENYGLGVFLTCSQELCQTGDGSRSYYSKFFSARGSEYFFSRPIIEARWDNTRKDDRGKFFVSSSVLSGPDNLMTLYLYNYYNGQPTNLNGIGTGPVYVRNYVSASTGLQISAAPDNPITGGWVEAGIYTASFALNTTEEVVFDRWSNADETICYYTGSYKPKTFKPSQIFYIPKYVTSIVNLKSEYCRDDNNRFRVFTREKNWDDTTYTRAAAPVQLKVVTDSYYKIFRVVDSKTVIDFGTGSYDFTRLSYDQSGSYFDLDISLLESGYEYGIKFAYFLNQIYEEQSETFTFRVE